LKKYILIFMVSFIVFLGVLGGSYLYLNKAEGLMQDDTYIKIIGENGDLAPPGAEDEVVINTLLLGVDEARSDTMMVARYNKETHQVAIISVPRDTRVDIPGYGFNKINAAVGKKEGTALAMKTVSNFLDIPIHHYVKVDFKGVEKIVDIMGGIKMDVPPGMDYEDPTQDLYIHIKPGVQILNGKQALHFLRFRSGYVNQDLGRIKAQQEFAKAFINKLTSAAMIPKALDLINAMAQNTKTNLEQGEIGAYALDITKIDADNIKMYTIPGDGGTLNHVAYFLHDEQKLREMMATMNSEMGATKQETSKDAPAATETKEVNTIDKGDIKIEILNSTKTKGLASTLKNQLEQKGFEVDKIGDTKDLNYSYSRVIDRRGDGKKLELVAKEAGINIIDSDIDPNYHYDITIIIGNDRK
jgi:polyisoprenyl-teichoic acid--peptidoglycan teichoic acid transferase